MKRNPAISFKVELSFFFKYFFFLVGSFVEFAGIFLFIPIDILQHCSWEPEQKERSRFIPLHIPENTYFKNKLIFIVFYLITFLRT